MIDVNFKDNLVKNRVLDNDSNKFDFLYLNNFNGDYGISVVSANNVYGYLAVECSEDANIQLCYDDVKIFDSSQGFVQVLPVHFVKGAIMKIAGGCSLIKIKMLGARFGYAQKNIIIPKLNYIYSNYGKLAIASYGDLDDIINNNLISIGSIDNVLFAECVDYGSNNFLGVIKNDDGVYYCSNMDNYTQKIYICDNADNAIFLQIANSSFCYVYVNDGRLYYKVDDSDPIEYIFSNNKRVSKIISPQINNSGIKVFGVYYTDGHSDLMYFDNFKIFKLLSIQGKNIKIVVDQNVVYLISFNNYNVSIVEYYCDTSLDIINMLNWQGVTSKNNIVDCFIIDNECVYISTGMCAYREIL